MRLTTKKKAESKDRVYLVLDAWSETEEPVSHRIICTPKDLNALLLAMHGRERGLKESRGKLILTTVTSLKDVREDETVRLSPSCPTITGADERWRYQHDQWPMNALALTDSLAVSILLTDTSEVGLAVLTTPGFISIERPRGIPKWTAPLAGYVVAAAFRHGVPPEFALAIMTAEGSGGDPKIRSHAKAIGIMQVMPDTGSDHGFSVADLEDPIKNIECGVIVIKRDAFPAAKEVTGLDEKWPRFLEAAAAAYNMGPGNLRKRKMDKHKWKDETVTYTSRVMAFMALWKAAVPKVGK